MRLRYLPPAHSPVSAGSLAGGLRGLALGRPAGVEQWLARHYDVDAGLLLDSGTSALRLAIESLATTESSRVRVALPAYGCYDLATATIGAMSDVSFYDVDPITLGPEWASFETVLSAGVDAVVLVHQYGVPVDLDRARQLAEAQGTLVIEDAAQGAGAWWRNRRLGSWGDLGVLSFGRGKGMTAGGGGALLASGPRGSHLLEQTRTRVAIGRRGAGSLARLAAQALLSHPMLYGVPARMPWLALGDTPYHDPWAPRAIDAGQAGVLESAAALADVEAGTRSKVASLMVAGLSGNDKVRLINAPGGEGTRPGWLRFPALLKGISRAGAGSTRFRHLGIMAGYPRLLPDLPQLSAVRDTNAVWPGAAHLASELVTLPTHRWVTTTDMDAVVALLRA